MNMKELNNMINVCDLWETLNPEEQIIFKHIWNIYENLTIH